MSSTLFRLPVSIALILLFVVGAFQPRLALAQSPECFDTPIACSCNCTGTPTATVIEASFVGVSGDPHDYCRIKCTPVCGDESRVAGATPLQCRPGISGPAESSGSAPIPAASSAPAASGSTCTYATECPTGFTCPTTAGADGTRRCTPAAANGTTCTTNSQCGNGGTCNSGRCVSPPGATTPAATPATESAPSPSAPGATTPASSNGLTEQLQGSVVVPELAVPIPGLDPFEAPAPAGSGSQAYLDLPFLGQYIGAVYSYALGVAVTLATVMVVIGGLKWMLARGDSSKVSDAKETLSRAIIGMFLVLGSYTVLNFINPELVGLRALRIQVVERREAEEIRLLSTRSETSGPADSGSTSGSGGRSSYTRCTTQPASAFPDCPVRLQTESTCGRPITPRVQEFINQMRATVTTGNGRERTIRIADAATKCGLHMGSCGKTWETIVKEAANARVIGPPGRSVSTTLLRPFQDQARACIAGGGEQQSCKNQAKRAARTAIRGRYGDTDTWAEELRPGDVVWIYNANSLNEPNAAGNHSAIFISWSNPARTIANVVQGMAGHYVTRGTLCLKSACNGLTTLIYKVE